MPYSRGRYLATKLTMAISVSAVFCLYLGATGLAIYTSLTRGIPIGREMLLDLLDIYTTPHILAFICAIMGAAIVSTFKYWQSGYHKPVA